MRDAITLANDLAVLTYDSSCQTMMCKSRAFSNYHTVFCHGFSLQTLQTSDDNLQITCHFSPPNFLFKRTFPPAPSKIICTSPLISQRKIFFGVCRVYCNAIVPVHITMMSQHRIFSCVWLVYGTTHVLLHVTCLNGPSQGPCTVLSCCHAADFYITPLMFMCMSLVIPQDQIFL